MDRKYSCSFLFNCRWHLSINVLAYVIRVRWDACFLTSLYCVQEWEMVTQGTCRSSVLSPGGHSRTIVGVLFETLGQTNHIMEESPWESLTEHLYGLYPTWDRSRTYCTSKVSKMLTVSLKNGTSQLMCPRRWFVSFCWSGSGRVPNLVVGWINWMTKIKKN